MIADASTQIRIESYILFESLVIEVMLPKKIADASTQFRITSYILFENLVIKMMVP
jgi:hypothetical protein